MEPTKKLKTEEVPIPAKLPPEQPNLKQRKQTKRKQREVYRKAGGETWVDPSLADWPQDDYRVFVGDLGQDVTEEVLRRAFRKYSSLQKVKVVYNKQTGKSKGYGFLSFAAEDDYIRAMREMDGKFVGNRPVKLRRSDWKKRAVFRK